MLALLRVSCASPLDNDQEQQPAKERADRARENHREQPGDVHPGIPQTRHPDRMRIVNRSPIDTQFMVYRDVSSSRIRTMPTKNTVLNRMVASIFVSRVDPMLEGIFRVASERSDRLLSMKRASAN